MAILCFVLFVIAAAILLLAGSKKGMHLALQMLLRS